MRTILGRKSWALWYLNVLGVRPSMICRVYLRVIIKYGSVACWPKNNRSKGKTWFPSYANYEPMFTCTAMEIMLNSPSLILIRDIGNKWHFGGDSGQCCNFWGSNWISMRDENWRTNLGGISPTLTNLYYFNFIAGWEVVEIIF